MSIIRLEESKGGGRTGHRGIEAKIQALIGHDYIEFLMDGEVVQFGRNAGRAAWPPSA